ncbi:MAG: hypothetical protein ACRDZX_16075, partial [Acidimicrobiales bacterium]
MHKRPGLGASWALRFVAGSMSRSSAASMSPVNGARSARRPLRHDDKVVRAGAGHGAQQYRLVEGRELPLVGPRSSLTAVTVCRERPGVPGQGGPGMRAGG